MNPVRRKVYFYHHWDWYSISKISGIFLFLVLFILIITAPNPVRSFKLLRMGGETWGYILRVKENTTIRHTELGHKFQVESYSVVYTYSVNGISYTRYDRIPAGIRYTNQLNILAQNQYRQAVSIKYKLNQPRVSLIDLLN